MSVRDDTSILNEQVAYYRARAAEYDEWILRTGRYDRGEAHRERWRRELAMLEDTLKDAALTGDVLELACGTGWWTPKLAERARRVLAVDSSREALAISRERTAGRRVHYVAADIFSLPLTGKFDALFFSFWLSHVPAARFEEFWLRVRAALKPGGRVLFFDSLLEPTSTATDHAPLDESGVVRRRLNDGREFRVVKIFYQPEPLRRKLAEFGWTGAVRSTGTFFLHSLLTAA